MDSALPMIGKTVFITGSTSGIGEAAAIKFYQMGAQVILHGRNPVRCAATIERIRQATNETRTGRLDFLIADLSDMQSVYKMTQAFKQRFNRLDVLINNAGVFNAQRQQTRDGLEMTFAVNHLGAFLLTRQLLDILKASAPSRIIIVSSSAHANAKPNFSDLQMVKQYQGFLAYANSKLYNLLFAYELARRLRRSNNPNVTVTALHPGYVSTGIGMNNGRIVTGFLQAFQKLPIGRRRLLSAEEAAEFYVYAATDESLANQSGKYLNQKEIEATSVQSYDHDLAERLWTFSEIYLQRLVPEMFAIKDQPAAEA